MVFKRLCRRCGERFEPFGKYNFFCKECLRKTKQGKYKNIK